MGGHSVLATEDGLFEKLHDMYWKAATREVCNMILLFNEIFQAPESASNTLKLGVITEGQNFKRMFDLWTGAHDFSNKPQFNTTELYNDTLRRARERWVTDREDVRRLCARWILQSSSFLDIDILHEPAQQIFSSDKPDDPNVEQVVVPVLEQSGERTKVLWRGLFCSKCTCLIRSPFYYECTEGCQWSVGLPYDVLYEDKVNTIVEAPSPSLAKAAWRLCSICAAEDLSLGSCNREHLERICYKNPTGPNIWKFRKELSKLEGSQRQITRAGGIRTTAMIRKLIQNNLDIYGIKNELKKVATPAGSFHVAFMLGPLIIERGIEETNHGVLIAPRPLPHLCLDTTVASWFINDIDGAAPSPGAPHGVVLFKDRVTKTKKLSDLDPKIHRRQIIGTVKRVYGAAFSGYIEENVGKESAVVDVLVSAAASCEINPSKTVKANHFKLLRSAEKVVGCLLELLGNEIAVHLRRIAKRLLDPKTELSWNIITNNCQRLVNALLRGKDFEYSFPRLPKDFGTRDRDSEGQYFNWPRYLISFGNQLDGLHFADSIITSFCRRQRHQCDLIDLMELLHQSWKVGEDKDRDLGSWHELRLAPNGSGDADLTRPRLDNLMFEKLWELPLDTLSVIQFHLLRPSHRYRNCHGKMISQLEWIENRLRLSRQLYVFSIFAGGLGAALLAILHRKPCLLSKIQIPKSRVLGSIRADERVKVIRSTPWNAIYFILNRKSPHNSWLYDAPCSASAEHDIMILESFRKMFNLSEFQVSAVKLLWAQPLAFSANNADLSIMLAPSSVGVVNLIVPVLVSLTGSLVRRRLYGKKEWISLAVGSQLVVLIQNFKKSKSVR